MAAAGTPCVSHDLAMSLKLMQPGHTFRGFAWVEGASVLVRTAVATLCPLAIHAPLVPKTPQTRGRRARILNAPVPLA